MDNERYSKEYISANPNLELMRLADRINTKNFKDNEKIIFGIVNMSETAQLILSYMKKYWR